MISREIWMQTTLHSNKQYSFLMLAGFTLHWQLSAFKNNSATSFVHSHHSHGQIYSHPWPTRFELYPSKAIRWKLLFMAWRNSVSQLRLPSCWKEKSVVNNDTLVSFKACDQKVSTKSGKSCIFWSKIALVIHLHKLNCGTAACQVPLAWSAAHKCQAPCRSGSPILAKSSSLVRFVKMLSGVK